MVCRALGAQPGEQRVRRAQGYSAGGLPSPGLVENMAEQLSGTAQYLFAFLFLLLFLLSSLLLCSKGRKQTRHWF